MGLFQSCNFDESLDESSGAAGAAKAPQVSSPDLFSDLPKEFNQMYKRGPLLGLGSTSQVYSLKHNYKMKTGKAPPLVMKFIDKSKLRQGPNFDLVIRQLRSEASILKNIRHQNIVDLYDTIESKSAIYLILGYISGEELFNYIIDRGPLSEQGTKSVMRGVLSAMNYLHGLGIVHRDIKAENLLISETEDGEYNVKLIDFGFSKNLGFDLTKTYMGTDGYMAPEIRQQKEYGFPVDLWSCGVLMYVISSGTLPFARERQDFLPTEMSVVDLRAKYSVKFTGSKWPKISANAKSLVSALLEVDPLLRLSSNNALHHEWFRPKVKKATSRQLIVESDSHRCRTPPIDWSQSKIRIEPVEFTSKRPMTPPRTTPRPATNPKFQSLTPTAGFMLVRNNRLRRNNSMIECTTPQYKLRKIPSAPLLTGDYTKRSISKSPGGGKHFDVRCSLTSDSSEDEDSLPRTDSESNSTPLSRSMSTISHIKPNFCSH